MPSRKDFQARTVCYRVSAQAEIPSNRRYGQSGSNSTRDVRIHELISRNFDVIFQALFEAAADVCCRAPVVERRLKR